MIRNPEFVKNLRLSFSLSKLLIPIVICVITVILCIYSDNFYWEEYPREYLLGQNLFGWFCTIGFIYSIVIGTFSVTNSFAEEFKLKTWDSICMSKISAKDLLIGKVFGANASVWLCSLFLIVPMLASSVYLRIHSFNEFLAQDYRLTVLYFSLCLLSWIIFSYMFAISSVLFRQLNIGVGNVGEVLVPLVIFNIFLGALITSLIEDLVSIALKDKVFHVPNEFNLEIGSKFYMKKPAMIHWYGYKLLSFNLFSLFLMFFSVSSIFLCLKLLQTNLQSRQKPVYWFLFCIVSAFLISGIEDLHQVSSNLHSGIFFLYVLTLVTLVVEISNRNKMFLYLQSLKKKNYPEIVGVSPIFLRTFAVLLLFCLLNNSIVSEPKSILFSLSIIGLLFRDFLALSLITRLKNSRFLVLLNTLYLLIFYAFFPILLNTLRTNNTTT